MFTSHIVQSGLGNGRDTWNDEIFMDSENATDRSLRSLRVEEHIYRANCGPHKLIGDSKMTCHASYLFKYETYEYLFCIFM